MKKDVILVLDCGATNVRAIAVERQRYRRGEQRLAPMVAGGDPATLRRVLPAD